MKYTKVVAIGVHAKEHIFSRVLKIGSAIKYFLLSGMFFISGLMLASYSSQSMAATCGICDSQYLQCLNTESISSCKSAHKSCMSVCMSDGSQKETTTSGAAEWFAGLILGGIFAFALMYTADSIFIDSEYNYCRNATIIFGAVVISMAFIVAFQDRGIAFYAIFNALCFLVPPSILTWYAKEDSKSTSEKEVKSEEQKKTDVEGKNPTDEIGKKYDVPKGKSLYDLIDETGMNVSLYTVAELAEKTGKTERAIKANLTRAQLRAKDYDGRK